MLKIMYRSFFHTRYMLLPALLGYLQMKVTSEDRKTVIKKARVSIISYLYDNCVDDMSMINMQWN